MGTLFDFSFFWENQEAFLQSVVVTVSLSASAVGVSFVSGAVGWRLIESKRRYLSVLADAYVQGLRNTPVLAFIYIAYFGLTDVGLVLPASACVILALGLQGGAYNIEILRGANKSVATEQREAARALALSPWKSLVFVEAPQVLRVAFPALGNQIVATILSTSLASTIAVPELTYESQVIGELTYKFFAVFAVDAILYVMIVQLFIVGWHALEHILFRKWSAGI